MNRALLVAFHFPPVQVSSGLQRTLAHTRYLPEHAWEPIVLTAHRRAFEQVSEDQLKDIPEGTIVKRAFALDTTRHLAIAGRYTDLMALPDRWCSWWLGGFMSGWRLIRRYRPRVIWSTYPIATAHLIGLTLHKLSGLPWVADFRDSMTEDDYPREGLRRKVFLWIERATVRACRRAVFTTPGALKMYAERYPDIPATRWALIPNGYNEDIFAEVENQLPASEKTATTVQPLKLLHSGVIYPSERDPGPLFEAISRLKQSGAISAATLKIVLRAPGHDELFAPMLVEHGIQDIVSLEPGVSYREALREILTADGLLVLQASNCNHQIPAKIYEYFRARRPIFALTDERGDTASTLREAGINSIVPLENASAIAAGLEAFLEQLNTNKAAVASEESIRKSSRSYASEQLARMFQEIISTL